MASIIIGTTTELAALDPTGTSIDTAFVAGNRWVWRPGSTTTARASVLGAGSNGRWYAADYSATDMPNTGTWAAGDYVRNSAPVVAGSLGSFYVVMGWLRVTSGSANVLNTDWVECHALTGT